MGQYLTITEVTSFSNCISAHFREKKVGFKYVDQQVRMRWIRGDLVQETKEMCFLFIVGIKKADVRCSSIFGSLPELSEKRDMVKF
jgi:hypothetical protein